MNTSLDSGIPDTVSSRTPPASVVHALIELGLSALEAWNCLHSLQGSRLLVVTRCEGPSGSGQPIDAGPRDLCDAARASGEGAVWSGLQDGGWQYAEQVNCSPEALDALQQELRALCERLGAA